MKREKEKCRTYKKERGLERDDKAGYKEREGAKREE